MKGILVDLLVAMVSVPTMILDVLEACVYMHVCIFKCAWQLSTLLLVEVKTCLRSD